MHEAHRDKAWLRASLSVFPCAFVRINERHASSTHTLIDKLNSMNRLGAVCRMQLRIPHRNHNFFHLMVTFWTKLD